MARPIPQDPPMKVNFRIRQSLQIEIELLSEELNIPQGKVVDIILSSSLPVFEKIYEKKLSLMKK